MIHRALAACAFALIVMSVPARAADIQNIDLGKNATVWFAEDHTVPIIAFNISMPAGSAYDPAGKSGLASFAASMMDEGAGDLSSKAFHEAIENRAIGFSARAERDHLVISITTLKENAPEAMRLLQMALMKPRFEADALARVKTQIIQSLQQDQVEPPRVAGRAFANAFFGNHPYAHAVVGNIPSVSSITAGDLRAFVGHQSNMRLLAALGERLGIEWDRQWHNVEWAGNQAGAGVATAFSRGWADHGAELTPGDHVLLAAVGGGYSGGAILLEWVG